MDLDQIARETAATIDNQVANMWISRELNTLSPDERQKQFSKTILSALNKAVKETRQDLLELLASTDETEALHSKFTGRYRGI